MDSPLLAIEKLSVQFHTEKGVVRALDGVDLTIGKGEIFALLGESGSGKSVTSLSVMRLIPSQLGKVAAGRILFKGQNLLDLSMREMADLRGSAISMIFQEPISSLNPVLRVGSQVAEVIRRHKGASKAEAKAAAISLLGEVGIADPARRYDSYPHELSGGMCQRVMIAMAISCDPELLIADEPTTALDATIQKQIMDLINDLRARRNTAVLLVTHDLGVVAQHADRAAVMYAGKIVEEAPVDVLFSSPAHPYSRGLLDAMPDPEDDQAGFTAIPGNVPDLLRLPQGCAFSPRCAHASDVCHRQAPERSRRSDTHLVRCWNPLEPTR
jgi:oligopeptide/dipeptide ABC transporter ATP-binding protein